jgi:hypothetical protein
MKYLEPHKHDLQQRLRCASQHILRAEKTERMPQAMRPQCLFAGGIGGDSWRYDSNS